jgi:NitT/TauT family transport system ATP-binding protein
VLVERRTTTLLVSHDLDEAVLLADEVLLLTKRPTRVAENLPFDVARPRTADTTITPAFIATKTRALDVFQREVRKP